jgi:hypothetical protein
MTRREFGIKQKHDPKVIGNKEDTIEEPGNAEMVAV